MGYSVELMALFSELADRGYFKDVQRAIDLGSQEMHFAKQDVASAPYKESIRVAIHKISGLTISGDQLETLSNRASAGSFFSILGVEYKSLDTDGWYGAPFDFNFDQIVPMDQRRYCLMVNAGTTEHLINQLNAFSVAHSLTRSGGLMIHGVPFLGHIDHGFFNYNPNFFTSLARFNSYEILGLWLCPSNAATLIPYGDGAVLRHLNVSQEPEHSISLFCAFRKTSEADFCVPFQAVYESQMKAASLDRYSYAVDGARMSGALAFEISQKAASIETLSGRTLIKELVRRVRRRVGLGPR
jgi:hypothetical protein